MTDEPSTGPPAATESPSAAAGQVTAPEPAGLPPALPPVEQGMTAVGGTPGRAFPLRWAIAAVATGIVVVGAAAVWLLLAQPHPGTASAAWLPADTIGYAELSADLSTGQRDNVLGLLKRFPGFEDQSHLGDKLDESFQRVLERVGIDYGAAVKPWLGDSVSMGIRAPAAPGGSGSGAAKSLPPFVALVSSTNDAAATAFIQTVGQKASQQGATVTSETYRGVTVTTVSGLSVPVPDQTAPGAPSGPHALAVVDGRLVAGEPDMVRAVIDVRRAGAAALSGRGAFNDAIASLPSDRIGALWVDPAGLLASAQEQLQSVSPVAGLLVFSPDAALLGSLTAESDGLVAEVHGRGTFAGAALLNPSPGTGGPHGSRLISSVPANAVVYAELHDVGATIRTTLQAARQAEPSAGQSIDQVNQALAVLGTNIDELSGVIGDAAVVATLGPQPTAGQAHVAILIEVRDQAIATRLVSQIGALAALSGVAHVTRTDYQGVTINHVALTSGTVPGSAAPVYALAGSVLIVGQDEDVVHAVIDAQRGVSTHAGDADYTAVTQRVGAETSSSLFVDLEALLSGEAGKSLSAESRAFVAPLHALGAGINPPGEHEWLGSSRLFILIR